MEIIGTGAAIAAGILGARFDNKRKAASATAPSKSLFSECVIGGAANAYTSALLNPMDVVKTRMQNQVVMI